MHRLPRFLMCIGFFIACAHTIPQYEVPKAKIEVFYPKGFEVSIPHEEGITLFAFHGKLNEEMEGLEAGTWSRDIVKVKNGRWTFRDREARLALGDTLYYWTYVIYNGLGYREDDGVFVVSAYSNATINTNAGGAKKKPPTDVGTRDANCKPTPTFRNGIQVNCAKQLLFEDDFTGAQLDRSHWTVERRFSTKPDYEYVLYLDDASDVLSVWNSVVTIKPKLTTRHFQSEDKPLKAKYDLGTHCTGRPNSEECVCDGAATRYISVPPFISAQFSTKDHFSFKYGRVEIKAKMPNAQWVFPQLWLQPVKQEYGSDDYQSGQMRIAFTFVNNEQMQLFGGLIVNANSTWRWEKMCEFPHADRLYLGNDFHIYTLVWTENEISVAVDNTEYCKFRPDNDGLLADLLRQGDALPNRGLLKSGSKMAPFDQEFYITLGYGIGGINDFPDMNFWRPEKPWGNTSPHGMGSLVKKVDFDHWLAGNGDMRIDYVKVFAI
ncbi:gram-negative bacteria-binding protein 3 [Ceratitis capitata]|uniref:gram-negative bacteria-binding protein 3 n=1 Tax=Ceratitis capitata TaxID=7213 RepID=UPI00032A0006|nr:gram-negative bacteria-binding protein 3 [Ceratitis capitata]